MSASLSRLQREIEEHTATIGVVGLGYVGLPVACSFAAAGYSVVGVELKPTRVVLINSGESPITGNEPGLRELLAEVVSAGRLRATADYSELAAADVITINVDTPLTQNHQPDYASLEQACRSLGEVLKQGALVIVESTISPGTMTNVVAPLLESTSGKKSGEDFFLGHCPERVMPGKLLANLRNVSRVVGGQTPEVAEAMLALYRQIVSADLDGTDLLTAELVKTCENAYRDVNIAFANEVALICGDVGADVWRVRTLVNKSPGRLMLMPGAGVGGHCIPKDPWLLATALPGRIDAEHCLIGTARAINDGMPAEICRMARECLSAVDVQPADSVIAVLGYSYLEDCDDSRNSPSAALVELLNGLGCTVRIHDPFVEDCAGNVDDTLRGADCAVVMVAHSVYRELNADKMAAVMRHKTLVDGRGFLSLRVFVQAGFVARQVGVGRSAAATQ